MPRFAALDEVVEFVRSNPTNMRHASAPNWPMVSGWFGRIPDIDRRWREIAIVAQSTTDEGTLTTLAVYTFEAIVDRSEETLVAHLESVAEVHQFHVMLGAIVPNESPRPTVERFLEQWQLDG